MAIHVKPVIVVPPPPGVSVNVNPVFVLAIVTMPPAVRSLVEYTTKGASDEWYALRYVTSNGPGSAAPAQPPAMSLLPETHTSAPVEISMVGKDCWYATKWADKFVGPNGGG